jgi:hypothetical protein
VKDDEKLQAHIMPEECPKAFVSVRSLQWQTKSFVLKQGYPIILCGASKNP